MNTMSILQGLQRLSESLQKMDDRITVPPKHYRDIPEDIQKSYGLMMQGASLVHATSTKYTLVGKISLDEQETVAQDLLKGCQFIAAGALVIADESFGCCRSTRMHTKRACRAVIVTVTQLVEAFHEAAEGHNNSTSAATAALLEKDNNLAAQKCGAVWSTCDVFLQKKVPQGNRNAMRRDLFTWMMECNETMAEFQEMIDRGPSTGLLTTATTICEGNDEATDEDSFDDFLQDDNEQYTAFELEIAKPCVAMVKCSRGTINVALKASECAGDLIKQCTPGEDTQARILQWIGNVHDKARHVGEGMTDLGTLLYPTLSIEDIESQGNKQHDAILAVLEYILDTTDMELSDEVVDMATKLRAVAQTRHDEMTKAIAAARQ